MAGYSAVTPNRTMKSSVYAGNIVSPQGDVPLQKRICLSHILAAILNNWARMAPNTCYSVPTIPGVLKSMIHDNPYQSISINRLILEINEQSMTHVFVIIRLTIDFQYQLINCYRLHCLPLIVIDIGLYSWEDVINAIWHSNQP